MEAAEKKHKVNVNIGGRVIIDGQKTINIFARPELELLAEKRAAEATARTGKPVTKDEMLLAMLMATA